MEQFEQQLHRTLIEFLTEVGMSDAARLVKNADLDITTYNFNPHEILIYLPVKDLVEIQGNNEVLGQIENGMRLVSNGHIKDQNGNALDVKHLNIDFRVKLVTLSDDCTSSSYNVGQELKVLRGAD